MKLKNVGMAGIFLGFIVFNAGCAATRTGSMAGTDSRSSGEAKNEIPLDSSYGAVKTTTKPSPMAKDALGVGQSPTDNGTPPSNSRPIGDPMNQ